MKIIDLLELDLGKTVSVLNEPFIYTGRSEVTLDDSTKVYWLVDDNDSLLAVAPDDEELVLFKKIDEEIEPSETVLYQNKEYEFNYEDAGNITDVQGSSQTEEADRYLFTDYQSSDGEIVRKISNENTGETHHYIGRTVSEDDLTKV